MERATLVAPRDDATAVVVVSVTKQGDTRRMSTLLAALLAVACADPALAAPAPAPTPAAVATPNAHFIIAFGAKTRAEAEEWMVKRARERTIPSREADGFPRVLDSSTVKGMNPGFFIVVLGVSDDAAIAQTIAKELKAHGGDGTYVKAAFWDAPEPLRVLLIDEVVDDGGIVPEHVEYLEIFMMEDGPYDPTNVRGRHTIWFDKRAMLIFTRSAKAPPKFALAVSAQQTQCDEKPAQRMFTFEDKRVQRIKRYAISCFQGD
jgi:hypothetical protein